MSSAVKVVSLLEKGPVETVPPPHSKSDLYSRYFLVSKKNGGLRPILDPGHLNRALMRRPFKMLTLKQILSQVCPGGWFFSVDLKEAYLYPNSPPNRLFLRFAFEGVVYQYTVLPFRLSLAPRTFMKCKDAALSPRDRRGCTS